MLLLLLLLARSLSFQLDAALQQQNVVWLTGCRLASLVANAEINFLVHILTCNRMAGSFGLEIPRK